MNPLENPASSPFLRIRVGRVELVQYDEETSKSETLRPLGQTMGRVRVTWLDWYGGRDDVRIAFPSFSNPVEGGVGLCYGDVSLPSRGDIAVIGLRGPLTGVILGYLPVNYDQQTSDETGKSAEFGTMRRIIPGEFSRKSRQQAEVYHDKAGAVQIIVKAQPTEGGLTDGSGATSADDILLNEVPTTELARVTIGETYTDEEFTARATSSASKPVVARVRTASGASILIDSDGNVDISAAAEKAVTINAGTKGVARKDDQIKSVAADDSTFWNFISALVDGLVNTATVPLDGGAAYKAGIVAKLAALGVVSPQTAPQSLTGKITVASETVKAGD